MAGAIFLFAQLLFDLVVFALDFGVGNRIALEVFLNVGAHQHVLPGEFKLRGDIGLARDAELGGFLHHDFAVDQLFLDGLADLRAVGPSLAGHFLDHRVGARHRDGDAVDGGNVLRVSGAGGNQQGNGGGGEHAGGAVHSGSLDKKIKN